MGLRAVKVRLYLNTEQKQKINSLIGASRFVYNKCLGFKIDAYKMIGASTSIKHTSEMLSHVLRPTYEWLNEPHLNTKVLKAELMNLEQAYKNFFNHGSGFPKFKSKKNNQSVRFPLEAVSNTPFKDGKINLTKHINELKFRTSLKDKQLLLDNKNNIKSVTVSKSKTGKYYASFLLNVTELREYIEPINDSIGIDLGIKSFLVASTGEVVENLKFFRTQEKKIKRLHRDLSKKKKKSKNREKSRLKLAKAYEKVTNRRNDYLHNITTKIVNENQVIILEDLNVKGMIKNHKLAKAIQEVGWGEFKRQILYKSNWLNRDVVFIDRFYPSSKTCSCCGDVKKKLNLSERIFKCDCGNEMDRDLNAALNIHNEGVRLYNIQTDTSV